MQLGRALSWAAERFPERTAIGGPDPLTYRRWDARTSQYARALADAGAHPGERVVFLLANGGPLASLHLATQKLGVVSTPLNTRYGEGEVAYCVADAGPAVVVTDRSTAHFLGPVRDRLADSSRRGPRPAFLHVGDDVPTGSVALDGLAAGQPDGPLSIPVGPGDPSVMLYTSGTTGRPKGVPRTQHNEWSAALAHVVQCRYDMAGEATLGAMPLFHTMGIRSLLSMLVVGGRWAPVPALDPAQVAETLREEGVSCLY
ncbi:MAG: AMP-binding protein, partial [Streptomycetales bacterium]